VIAMPLNQNFPNQPSEEHLIAELGTLLARAEEIINQLGTVPPNAIQQYSQAKDIYNQIKPVPGQLQEGGRMPPEQFERIARGMPRR